MRNTDTHIVEQLSQFSKSLLYSSQLSCSILYFSESAAGGIRSSAMQDLGKNQQWSLLSFLQSLRAYCLREESFPTIGLCISHNLVNLS